MSLFEVLMVAIFCVERVGLEILDQDFSDFFV